MKQITFADSEYAGKRKQTRKKLFLIEMDQVAVEGFDCPDRAELPEGRRWGEPVDGTPAFFGWRSRGAPLNGKWPPERVSGGRKS